MCRGRGGLGEDYVMKVGASRVIPHHLLKRADLQGLP